MVRFFLIRHGESIQNTGENVQNLPDHKVYLTQMGKQQADECGVFLEEYCKEQGIALDNATLFVSPYERTRQTANIINSHLGIKDIKEDISLIEHQYGLFENGVFELNYSEILDICKLLDITPNEMFEV